MKNHERLTLYWVGLIIALFSAFSALFAAEPVSLLPLTQSHAFKNLSVPESVVFVASGGRFHLLAEGSSSFELRLTTPSGDVVTKDNAAVNGFDWSQNLAAESDLLGGGFAFLVTADVTELGNYTVVLLPNGQLDAGAVRFTQLGSISGRLIVASNDGQFAPGMPLSTAVILRRQGGYPLLGADVVLKVMDAFGEQVLPSSLPLDDGGFPDHQASDGVYSVGLSVPNSGIHEVRADVSWTDSAGGRTYRGNFQETINVSIPLISLSGEHSEKGIDENGNGLIEGVEFTFLESAARAAGEYSLTITLQNDAGERITASSLVSQVSAPLTVFVPSPRLSNLGGGGPWTIKSLNIWAGPQIVGVYDDLGLTLSYPESTFERNNTLIKGVLSDAANDLDGDGLFDRLTVVVTIDVLKAGDYGLSVDLKASSDEIISSHSLPSHSLSVGINHVPLTFLGSDIGRSGKNGPYVVTNMLVYSNSLPKATAWQGRVGETNFYACSDFVGCRDDMVAEIRRIAQGVCEHQSNQLLEKLEKVMKFADKQGNAADRQISGLYSRAVALEHSGSCPPALGVSGDRP